MRPLHISGVMKTFLFIALGIAGFIPNGTPVSYSSAHCVTHSTAATLTTISSIPG